MSPRPTIPIEAIVADRYDRAAILHQLTLRVSCLEKQHRQLDRRCDRIERLLDQAPTPTKETP